MTIRDVLVHLDRTPRSLARLEIATELAVRLRAQLVGLHINCRHGARLGDSTDASLTEETFQSWVSQQGLEGEWRTTQDSAVEAFVRLGRCADLTILGQPYYEGAQCGLSEREFVEILGRIGRPLLAVPYIGSFASIGGRALAVWDSGPEAPRAVNAALPLLCRGQVMQLLVRDSQCAPDFHVSETGKEILRHLSRHQVSAKVVRLFMEGGIERGEELLSHAADVGADLIIVGAVVGARWWNVRRRTFMQTLIKKMTVPILLVN